MPKGSLVWYDAATGYGTICSSDGRLVTFHSAGPPRLAAGDLVRYEIVTKCGMYTAVEVVRVNSLVGSACRPQSSPFRSPRSHNGPGLELIEKLSGLGVPADLAANLSRREAARMVDRLEHGVRSPLDSGMRRGTKRRVPKGCRILTGNTRKPGSHRGPR